MKANYKKNVQKEATMSLGSLYEVNQNLMKQMPVISEEEIDNLQDTIVNFLAANDTSNYFMLLCNDRKDYTIFHFTQPQTVDRRFAAMTDILDCMKNRGDLLAGSYDDNGAIELWIRIEEECYVYYFFPYDDAVLEY